MEDAGRAPSSLVPGREQSAADSQRLGNDVSCSLLAGSRISPSGARATSFIGDRDSTVALQSVLSQSSSQSILEGDVSCRPRYMPIAPGTTCVRRGAAWAGGRGFTGSCSANRWRSSQLALLVESVFSDERGHEPSPAGGRQAWTLAKPIAWLSGRRPGLSPESLI